MLCYSLNKQGLGLNILKGLVAGLVFAAVMAQAGEPPLPALPGFHPDPSICRAGDTYYLITSSFTWYPGLPIYASKDLREWTLVGHACGGEEWKSLANIPDASLGLWAPSIRYFDGKFHVACTRIDSVPKTKSNPRGRRYRNFVVTATDPAGPWSKSIGIKGLWGIDPGLFRDTDGKTYLVNPSGIIQTRIPHQNMISVYSFDPATGVLGKQTRLTTGRNTHSVYAEGPHLFRMRNGQYLLTVAEGGTGWAHEVTAFLSESVEGPFVPCAHNPVITRRDQPRDPLSATGHADLVESPDGKLYAVFLAVRRDARGGLLPFGRETFLCPATFDEGRQELRFDDAHLIAGTIREPRELIYRSANPGTRLRRVVATSDSEQAVATRAGEGLVIERSASHMLKLVRTADAVEVVKTYRGKPETLARVPVGKDAVALKLELADGMIRCFAGPSADKLTRIPGEWPWNFIADGPGFLGPGIGTVGLGCDFLR